jgi:ABC-type transporter Mla subunit MlaD
MNDRANTSVDTLRDRFDALDSSLKALIEAVNQVKNEITALQPSLESLSQSESVDEAESVEEPVPEKEQEPSAGIESPAFLEAVNTLPIPELTEKLKSANAKRNVIKNIVLERKKLNFQPFTSLEDLVTRIKGLAQYSLDKIMRVWS